MKKFISVALVAVMVLSMSLFMASCGGDDKETAEGGEGLVIRAVVATQLGDKSFNDSAKAGIDQLLEEGYDADLLECNTDSSLWEQNLRLAADEADIVIGVGSELDMIDKVASDEAYQDVKFIWVDNVAENLDSIPNLTCISYKQNEGSYLVGYIAGKMTETNVLGFVGGQDIDVINDFRVGYEQGVKAANPDAKVVHNYTNDWSDADAGANCGQDLASRGADIIFTAAGGSGSGVITKAEELGIKCIGVDADQRQTMSDYADDILCSMIKEVGKSIVDYVHKIAEDEANWMGGQVWYAGMDGGYIAVAYGAEDQEVLVPEDIRTELDAQIEKIQSGEIVVDSVYDN